MFGWDKDNKNGLFIAIPIHPSVGGASDLFNNALEKAQKPNMPIIIKKEFQFDIANARNLLVEQFLLTNCKYILFLDSDIIINENTILTLLSAIQEYNYHAITAVYFEKRGNLEPAIWHHSRVPTRRAAPYKLEELPCEIELCGMGCCLIDREVFEQTTDPWFRYTLHTLELPDDERISEDFYFAYVKMYKEFGERIFAIPHIVGHLGRCIVRGPNNITLI